MTDGSSKNEEPTSKRKLKRLLSERSVASLRRARKAAGPSFDDDPEQTSFLLTEARVIALLDVADALRGGNGPDGDAPAESD